MTDTPVFPSELREAIGGVSQGTLARFIKAGKVPEPDVKLTHKTYYWHRATLVAVGLMRPTEVVNGAA